MFLECLFEMILIKMWTAHDLNKRYKVTVFSTFTQDQCFLFTSEGGMEFKNRSKNRYWCLMDAKCKQCFRSNLNVEIIIISYFCESIEISTYDQTFLQLFTWNNDTWKNIYNVYKLAFRPVKLPNFNIALWSWIFTIIDVKQW